MGLGQDELNFPSFTLKHRLEPVPAELSFDFLYKHH